MPGEQVVDASVLGAALFDEEHSAAAQAFLIDSDTALVAPELLMLEFANIAAKKTWRGDISFAEAARAVAGTRSLLRETASAEDLADRAFELGATHRFSAYDAAYLALAEMRGLTVATLDLKLVNRARDSGLGHLVRAITEA